MRKPWHSRRWCFFSIFTVFNARSDERSASTGFLPIDGYGAPSGSLSLLQLAVVYTAVPAAGVLDSEP